MPSVLNRPQELFPEEPPPPSAYPPQIGGMVPFPGQDPQFLQWLFNFKKEVSIPLRFLWRGYEQGDDGRWKPKPGKYRVMNEDGITWAISLIESFINPVYVVSNYTTHDINWTMRHVGRTVYNNLSFRYVEFGLHKLDIHRVAIEVISKVHAILLGARDNGYRRFFSTTHQHQELKSFSESQQGGGGFLGMFRQRQNAPSQDMRMPS